MRPLIALIVIVSMWSLILLEGYVQSDHARRRWTTGQLNRVGAAASLSLMLMALWIMRDFAFGRRMLVDPRAMAAVALPFMFLLWFTVPARGTGLRGIERDEEERTAFQQFAIVVALATGLFYMVAPWLLPGL